jgi:hypothetical protein
VRAFCVEGVDEFLAHITTIEAALGLQSDFPGATRRMVKRVTTLLGALTDGDSYRHLFDLRSCYLHGRPMDEIPTKDRLLAHRLARRVVNGIADAALKMPKRNRARNSSKLSASNRSQIGLAGEQDAMEAGTPRSLPVDYRPPDDSDSDIHSSSRVRGAEPSNPYAPKH